MEDLRAIKDIPMYKDWIKIEPVLKGFSDDKKFFIEDKNGEKFLLKLFEYSSYENKLKEFNFMKLVETTGINMQRPIEFGVCNGNKNSYMLLSWVSGSDCVDVINDFSKKFQYELGVKAGGILSKIHSIPFNKDVEDWALRYGLKIRKKIEGYKNCSIKIPEDFKYIKILEESIGYLKNRPQTFHHGDFHLGNLVISEAGELGVIDFNRSDYGDPWEEFNRSIFTWQVSIPFMIGQIHGYFNNDIPDEFFRLLLVYMVTNAIGSIYWAIPFGEEEVNYMIKNAEELYDVYDGFKSFKPNWYQEKVEY